MVSFNALTISVVQASCFGESTYQYCFGCALVLVFCFLESKSFVAVVEIYYAAVEESVFFGDMPHYKVVAVGVYANVACLFPSEVEA